jgi:hypothetical protein
MWAHACEASGVITRLFGSGCVLTADDERGLAALAAARRRYAPDATDGSVSDRAENLRLMRCRHDTWGQPWHSIDVQGVDAHGDLLITARIQNGLEDIAKGPRDLAETRPAMCLEEFIEALDTVAVLPEHEIPPGVVVDGHLRVGGEVGVTMLTLRFSSAFLTSGHSFGIQDVESSS